MSRIIGWVRTALTELWALIVDDGLLAFVALAAIGVTFVASESSLFGTRDVTGWLLVVLIVIGVAVSVRRAVIAKIRADR